MSDEQQFEAQLQERGINAPRLTPELIDSKIGHSVYFRDETMVICVITLTNGHKVVGTSRPVSDANFREDLGQQAAFREARAKIWEIAGFELRLQLRKDAEADQLVARGPGG